MSNDTKVIANIKVNEIIKKEDFEFILETIGYVKLWLILVVLIIIKIVIVKTITICKNLYSIHNKRILRKNIGNTNSENITEA